MIDPDICSACGAGPNGFCAPTCPSWSDVLANKGTASRSWLLLVNRDYFGFENAIASAQKAHGVDPAKRHWSQSSPDVFWRTLANAEARLPPPPSRPPTRGGVDW